MLPASRASEIPTSVRSTSAQPVKRFARFHSDCPCLTRMRRACGSSRAARGRRARDAVRDDDGTRCTTRDARNDGTCTVGGSRPQAQTTPNIGEVGPSASSSRTTTFGLHLKLTH
eukprot:scaffold76848_cov66-Phaeocystis_antarctica.AAC.2